MNAAKRTPQLSDLPLWRLIVLLDDLERSLGPGSQTALTVARLIRERLDRNPPRKGGRDAD